MPDRQEQWAVFWCSLLGPLLYGEVPPEEAGRFLNQLAATEHVFPDGQRRRPSRATVWRKWKQYREGGFEALFPKRRSDRGRPRKATSAMIAKAIELKTEQPYRSDVPLNQFLQSEFGKTIPKSTLYRHLKRAGATRLKLGISQRKVRRRWTRDHSNALWLGDFEDGPCVLVGDRAAPTHLSAFIDCHSRYVVEARYYLRENLDVLIDSLLRAWSAHGASRELYLDNAKIYHANALKAACFALNIRLIHRGVGDPPPGGLIERFFGTAQGQLESEVRAGEILTLDRLNQALAAWLEVSYHQQPNSETGQSPRERYHQGQRFTRLVNVQEVLKYFLQRARRKVHPDFSDVQLGGLFFQVDPRLRGDWVEVRYDPFVALETVLLYSLEGEYLGVGTRHQRQSAPDQPPKHPTPKPKHNYLDLLIQKHEHRLGLTTTGSRKAKEKLMFLNHFQFTSQPFAERVSAAALWQDDRMQQGLARLRYLAEQATVALVTGASGVGKSALLKRFLHELHGPRWQPVYLHLTHLPAAGLLKLLVGKLGELPRRGKERLFEQILGKARQAEGGLLVVLDEAHLIDTEALTDIRLLISSALDDAPPLRVVLAGQEPLRQTLRQSLHAALLNRISVRFHLAPLSKEQTASYIDFQLKQAGGSEKLFDPAAKNLIHDYSGGIPRQINNLATACLLQAAAQNAIRISEAMLQQTLSEFQLP